MTFLGMRKYPTPINKPMMPFFIGAVVCLYGVNSLASTLMETAEWKNDPRNLKAAAAKDHTNAH